jgi:hypothetical protein
VVTPDLAKTFAANQLLPAEAAVPAGSPTAARELAPGKELAALVSIYVEADYDVRVAVEQKDGMGSLALQVDGGASVPLVVQQQGRRGGGGGGGGQDGAGGAAARPHRRWASKCGWHAGSACYRWPPMVRRSG